jgi:hypothetical protein
MSVVFKVWGDILGKIYNETEPIIVLKVSEINCLDPFICKILTNIISFFLSVALQPFEQWPLFQFLNFIYSR